MLLSIFFNSCPYEKRLLWKQVKHIKPVFANPATINNWFQAKNTNAYYRNACVELKKRCGGKNRIIVLSRFMHGTLRLSLNICKPRSYISSSATAIKAPYCCLTWACDNLSIVVLVFSRKRGLMKSNSLAFWRLALQALWQHVPRRCYCSMNCLELQM